MNQRKKIRKTKRVNVKDLHHLLRLLRNQKRGKGRLNFLSCLTILKIDKSLTDNVAIILFNNLITDSPSVMSGLFLHSRFSSRKFPLAS